MAEAADELMKENPTVAHCITTARLAYMEVGVEHVVPDINNLIEMVSCFDKPEFSDEDLGEGPPIVGEPDEA